MAQRLNSRNGYRDRAWDTRAGQVSRLCGELDERVGAFLNRQIEGDWRPSTTCSPS